VKLFVEEGSPRTSKKLSPEVRPFYGMRDEICLENGVLMMGHRIVLPKSLQLNVLEEIHASHLGINKTKRIARSYIWWPSKYVWERIHVDFLGPMNGNYYFVLIDMYSK
jgi:hypothetical protein